MIRSVRCLYDRIVVSEKLETNGRFHLFDVSDYDVMHHTERCPSGRGWEWVCDWPSGLATGNNRASRVRCALVLTYSTAWRASKRCRNGSVCRWELCSTRIGLCGTCSLDAMDSCGLTPINLISHVWHERPTQIGSTWNKFCATWSADCSNKYLYLFEQSTLHVFLYKIRACVSNG